VKCRKEAKAKLVDKWCCRKCYSSLVEQKIRHNLRNHRIEKGCRLLVSDRACEYVAKKVIHLPVTIVKNGQKADYTVLPWTLDDENEDFLKKFFEKKEIFCSENPKIIKLFYPISKDEMKTYLAIKKVPFKRGKSEINTLLDAFDEKYPGTKTALLSSEEKLRQIICE
jgi:hypothetical protein